MIDQKLKQVTEGIVQMPTKHWQTWDINHFSMKHVPVFYHPHNKEAFPTVWPSSGTVLCCSFSSISSRSRTWHLPLLLLLREMQGAVRSPLGLLFSGLKNPASPYRTCPVIICAVLLWAFSRISVYFSFFWTTHYLKWGNTNGKYSRRVTFFDRI